MKQHSNDQGQSLFDDFSSFQDIDQRKFVEALARGLELLRAFTPSEMLLGNGELSEKTRLPKATVTRITYTLERLGYLVHNKKLNKYQMSPTVLSFGYAALAPMRVREIAMPLMQELAEICDIAVALGIRDRLDLVYIEYKQSRSSLMLRLTAGSRIPIATSAMGRAMIAVLEEKEKDWLLNHLARRDPENWPLIRAGVEQAMRDVSERGFAVSYGDWQRDVNAVGVALVPPDGSGLFGLTCGGPTFRAPIEHLEQNVAPRLIDMVRTIEARLGGR